MRFDSNLLLLVREGAPRIRAALAEFGEAFACLSGGGLVVLFHEERIGRPMGAGQ